MSLGILIGASSLTVSAQVQKWLTPVAPPSLLALLSKDGHAPAERAFWNLLFWAVALHALPLLSIIWESRHSEGARGTGQRTNPAIGFLSILFLCQQRFLDIVIGRVLRCSVDPHASNPITNLPSSIIDVAKARIASAIIRDDIDDRINEEYEREFLPAVVGTPGVGVARVQHQPLARPEMRKRVIQLIDSFGIPVVRSRLDWKVSRTTNRAKFEAPIRADLVLGGQPGQEETIRLDNAWLVDVGAPHATGRLNSLLIRVSSPSDRLRELARPNGMIRVSEVSATRYEEALNCLIKRAGVGTGADSDSLFFGTTVDQTQVTFFDASLRSYKGALNFQ